MAGTPEVTPLQHSVLSGLGVKDPRILDSLLRTLDERMDLGAGLLVEHGDPAAVPYLGAALDRAVLDDDDGLLANQDVIELAAAIEDLGGVLTEEQERKVLTVRLDGRQFGRCWGPSPGP